MIHKELEELFPTPLSLVAVEFFPVYFIESYCHLLRFLIIFLMQRIVLVVLNRVVALFHVQIGGDGIRVIRVPRTADVPS